MNEPLSQTLDLYELQILCETALPALREFSNLCPDCQGSGEVMLDDDLGEQCKTCRTLCELISYLMPKPPKGEPVPVILVEAEDDDVLF
jgi:hypothetical protein